MAVDLALPAKKAEDPIKSVKFKWHQSLENLLKDYKEAYADIRQESISIDDLAALIIEKQISNDRAFKQWSKTKASKDIM